MVPSVVDCSLGTFVNSVSFLHPHNNLGKQVGLRTSDFNNTLPHYEGSSSKNSFIPYVSISTLCTVHSMHFLDLKLIWLFQEYKICINRTHRYPNNSQGCLGIVHEYFTAYIRNCEEKLDVCQALSITQCIYFPFLRELLKDWSKIYSKMCISRWERSGI